jgi:quinoprotein glucose dehydrogenase
MAYRAVRFLTAAVTVLVLVPPAVRILAQSTPARRTSSLPSTKTGEWPHYGGDTGNTRYSPLDQINSSNFNKLEVAWRFKTDHLGPRPEYKLEGTPLMVNGVLYATGGTRRSVVALDAKTGELIWAHSYREGKRAEESARTLSGRGLAYWTDGKGDDRVLYTTIGYRLVALDAKTGAMIPSFGEKGVVDLKKGVVYGAGVQIDLETGEIGTHATPTVVKNVIIVGAAMRGGFTPKTHNNTKGLVRAFDVRTGRLLWTFHTIPKPGEYGNETWLNESWAVNGNAGVWTQISVDEELELVYLPIESPLGDAYGGDRPGDNLFGESLVCVDLKTGKRKWHFQFVHHPIWDLDIPSPPILADVRVNGRLIKAVAQPTKQSWLYVFDRVTGQPLWPIEERPVPKGDVPGEWYSPTQPFVTKPPPYARNVFRVPDDVIDFTPEMRATALKILERYKVGPMFNPNIVGNVDGLLGALNFGYTTGGSNWPGGGYDPETNTVYVQANNSALSAGSLAPPPAGYSDIQYVQGIVGRPFQPAGQAAEPGSRQAAAPRENVGRLTVDGLPIMKPPYGTLTAINLERGDFSWQVPHGETPDLVRNHPALKGMNIPRTGQGGMAGLVVTKTLVVIGDPQITAPPGRQRGAMLRAYDKGTGKETGALWIPAPQSGSPMSYLLDGKQYIVVAVGGGNYSGEYLAFALPDSEIRARTESRQN